MILFSCFFLEHLDTYEENTPTMSITSADIIIVPIASIYDVNGLFLRQKCEVFCQFSVVQPIVYLSRHTLCYVDAML